MKQVWVTLSDAASELDCSTRTIERRVKQGKLQSRMMGGKREVLIERQDDQGDIMTDALSVIDDHNHHQIELADRLAAAYQWPLKEAQQQATIARKSARTAWIITATAIIALAGAGIGTTHVMGRLDNAQQRLVNESDILSATMTELAAEREQRKQAEQQRHQAELELVKTTAQAEQLSEQVKTMTDALSDKLSEPEAAANSTDSKSDPLSDLDPTGASFWPQLTITP